MDSKITTAVIAVAGWGTRWLPITKAIEKCMLPVGTRPVVDWAAADCIRAGARRIIFIIGAEHTQIRQYYDHHAELEQYLTDVGKTKYLETVRQPQYEGVHFEFLIQPKGRYGTAIPVAIASSAMAPDESFMFVNGDDFIYRPDGGSEMADFCEGWERSGANASLMGRLIAREHAPKYGILMTDGNGEFTGIREKPQLEEIPEATEPLINRGAYIISPELVALTQEYVAKPSPNDNKEYYITDIFTHAAAQGHHIKIHKIKGEHLDAGTPQHWLETNQRVMGV